jgi:hypothetical protein
MKVAGKIITKEGDDTLRKRVADVEVVYNTSPGTTTRAARRGLLLEGLRL